MTKQMWKYALAVSLGIMLPSLGCGDDGSTDGTSPTASGGMSGTASAAVGNDGATPSSGAGGTPDSSSAGQCAAKAVEASIPQACAECICAADAAVADACSAVADNACWALVNCVGECLDEGTFADPESCGVNVCIEFLGGVAVAQQVDPIVSASCSTECGE